MTVVTRYTELTGCRIPVQQAPMGSVSTAALAVVVADAGGVGSIGVLGMSPGFAWDEMWRGGAGLRGGRSFLVTQGDEP